MLCDQGVTAVTEFDFIKSIDALEKRPKIGIITGSEDESIIKKKEDLKASFIAKKPFDLSELERHINDALNAG
jgi:DNA-binding NarL/FixJ family response regulator